jgi:crotonobetainyl-CoA:carnitine CoA-transferase CaiB-like acyl-CoA transferase
LRVIALEQAVAGPFCSRNLADMGADVVKIEPPEGDFARQYDTVVNGLSSYFVWLNRNKRSLALNLRDAEGRKLLRRLVAAADVFVHNLAPGTPDRLGLDYQSLSSENPRLIWCGISGYGSDGPYRDRKGFDLLLQGEAGIIAATGTPESPAKVGFSIADACAGLYAFSSVLLALREREHAGRGRRIDISILDCLAEWMTPQVYYAMYLGHDLPRAGMRHNIIVPYGPYATGDGTSVNLAVQNPGQWERFCNIVLERPDLVDDSRFRSIELRVANRGELETLIETIFSTLTSQQVIARLEAADVPFGRLNQAADVAVHPQLVERGRIQEIETVAGPATVFLPPFNLLGLDPRLGPLPTLGQHTDEVLGELGLAVNEIERLREMGAVT